MQAKSVFNLYSIGNMTYRLIVVREKYIGPDDGPSCVRCMERELCSIAPFSWIYCMQSFVPPNFCLIPISLCINHNLTPKRKGLI